MLKCVLRSLTVVIELFVTSQTVDVVPTDTETLGHACVGPGAQIRAAASSRALRVFSEKDREALESVPALADALHERFVLWDVATIRGRLVALRRGVSQTPAIVFGAGKPESLAAFEKRVTGLLQVRRAAPA